MQAFALRRYLSSLPVGDLTVVDTGVFTIFILGVFPEYSLPPSSLSRLPSPPLLPFFSLLLAGDAGIFPPSKGHQFVIRSNSPQNVLLPPAFTVVSGVLQPPVNLLQPSVVVGQHVFTLDCTGRPTSIRGLYRYTRSTVVRVVT